jgi:hypothetical protein
LSPSPISTIWGLASHCATFVHGLLYFYDLHLHDLTLEGILHIATFITLCEAFLGIKPHFALWRCLFWVVLSFPSSAFLAMGVAQIQVRPHAAGRYLTLTNPSGFDNEMHWRRS